MKPQCETAADCLRELARVMEQFEIKSLLDAVNSEYVKDHNDRWCGGIAFPTFNIAKEWQFAIAEVEGKPVFPGDTLYYPDGNSWKPVSTIQAFHSSSWNPPKPKTVMVEMLVEDAEHWIDYRNFNMSNPPSFRLYEACKKALEQMK